MSETVAFGDMFGGALDALRELERHRAECRAVPCAKCERYACPRCRKQAPEEDRPCVECLLEDRLAAARATVPKRFRWALDADAATLAPRVQFPAIAGALTWARSPVTSSLVLMGGAGAGKTSLAVAMFGAWLRTHRDPSARVAEAFGLALERQRHPLGTGEAPGVAAAMSASLLVLDDLGSEQANRSEAIADVLFARHNADLPTWVTTWLSDAELAQRYGGGVARRILEGAKVQRLGVKS